MTRVYRRAHTVLGPKIRLNFGQYGFGQRERLGYNGAQEPAMAEETLIQKIRSLPPERVAEVEDFVDFLTARDQDRHFTQAATRLSEEAFRAVWDNADDAEYDRL
jgi:Protein of unknown function (DUF2281)